MKRRNFLSTLAAAGVLSATKPPMVHAKVISSEPQVSKSSTLDLNTLLAVTEVPGIAISGIVRGKPVQQVAGYRVAPHPSGEGPGAVVEPNTYFPAASLTKPVFAWAVRDLIRQGNLELRKPLQEYTDLGLSGEGKRITAEFVLTHTTGLANWRFQLDAPLQPEFAPGSRWRYSGEGIFLLQRVVEKIVGVPIATYMKEKVLLPLGMTMSTFEWSPELQATAAAGHDRRGKNLERSSVFYEKNNYEVITNAGLRPGTATYEQIVGAYGKAKAVPLHIAISPNMAGSLWTTAIDYPKFLRATLADIPRHAEDYRLRATVNPKIGWGLGWGVDETSRQPAWFHWGDGPGFKNFCWVQPETKTALALFTNGDHGQPAYTWAFRKLVGDVFALAWI